MPTLTFDEESHIYRLDGEVIPSVTQVLKEAGLIDARWYTEEGRERGEEVALVTELYDKGELGQLDGDVFDESTVGDEILPYLEAWKRFRAESGFVPEHIEEPFYHPILRYAGTPDREGSVGRRRHVMLDIKTGVLEPWHALQLAGYAACQYPGALRWAVYLTRGGAYTLHEHEDPNDLRVFQAALAIVNWKHNHKVKT